MTKSHLTKKWRHERFSVQILHLTKLVISFQICTLGLACTETSPSASENFSIGPLGESRFIPDGSWIVVKNGLIESIERHQPTIAPHTEATAGLFATPGLVDRHVHLPPRWLPGQPNYFRLMFLSHGVTTVRDMGSLGRSPLDIERFKNGLGPRVHSCGRPLTGASQFNLLAEQVASPSEVESAIRLNVDSGASCTKIHRGFPIGLLPAARAAADQFQHDLIGHLPRRARWSEDRLDEIQHICDPRCREFREGSRRELVEAARTSEVRHTPTLVAYRNTLDPNPRLRNPSATQTMPRIWTNLLWSDRVLSVVGFHRQDNSTQKAILRRVELTTLDLSESSATLYVGTDTPHPGVTPGVSTHQEMAYFEQLGIPLSGIWDAATRPVNSGGALVGPAALTAGSRADLLLFEADPTLDLSNLATLKFVIIEGKLVSVDDLRKRLNEQHAWIEGPLYRFAIEPAINLAVYLAQLFSKP